MNLAQFKDPVSQMCLAGVVVGSWPLIEEVARSNPFTVITNIFVTGIFRENSNIDTKVIKHIKNKKHQSMFLLPCPDISRKLR